MKAVACSGSIVLPVLAGLGCQGPPASVGGTDPGGTQETATVQTGTGTSLGVTSDPTVGTRGATATVGSGDSGVVTTAASTGGIGEPVCMFPTFPDNGMPLMQAGNEPIAGADPFVLFDASSWMFRMWFTHGTGTSGASIGYAVSDDGFSWNVTHPCSFANPQCVLSKTPGAWDAHGVETVSVLVKDGAFEMWHTGYPNCWFVQSGLLRDAVPGSGVTQDCGRITAIGRATSPDGITWTKDPLPVIVPGTAGRPGQAWEQPWTAPTCTNPGPWCGGPDEPSVLWDPQQRIYRAWYAAGATVNGKWRYRIGYATSIDGIGWTKHGVNPVFVPQEEGWDTLLVSHTNVIPDPGGGYHLFYSGGPSTNAQSIGHAYSPDGLSWERNPANPIIDFGQEIVNGEPVQLPSGGPSAVIRDGVLYLFFMRPDEPLMGFGGSTLWVATTECRGGG